MQTIKRLNIVGIDNNKELMANFNPSFLEIKRKGLRTLSSLKIFNLSKLFCPSKNILEIAKTIIAKS